MKYVPLLHLRNPSVLTTKPGAQVVNQKRPNSINPKQIKCKEDNCYQSNDGRVLYFVGRWPRDPPHLGASVTQKLHSPSKKSGGMRLRRLPFAPRCWRLLRHSARTLVLFLAHRYRCFSQSLFV